MTATIYSEVTSTIIAQLAQGVRPWAQPWANGFTGLVLPKRANGEFYSGINILTLNGAMMANGWSNPHFMTFQQAKELGGSVIKGSKASKVIYAGAITKEEDGQNGETVEVKIPYAKVYSVFNAEQISGLPERFYGQPRTGAGPDDIAHARAFIGRTGAEIVIGGSKAYYRPSTDSIALPPLAAFKDAESFYSTALHELAHWTGAEHRLNRTFGKRFGDEAYSVEELVAELTAAFLCAELGISAEPREDHAQYLSHWLKVLKADSRAIFSAASQASKAAEYIRQAAAQGVEAPIAVEAVETVAAPVAALPSPKASRRASKAPRTPAWPAGELDLPQRLGAKASRRVGDFLAMWSDGSTTLVRGVVYTGQPWAAAYQAANLLRRSREGSRLYREEHRGWMSMTGAMGLTVRSPAFLAYTHAMPMAELACIRCEASGQELDVSGQGYGAGSEIAAERAKRLPAVPYTLERKARRPVTPAELETISARMMSAPRGRIVDVPHSLNLTQRERGQRLAA